MRHPYLRLGKREVKRDARTLLFADYRRATPLPLAPRVFGHENFLGFFDSWGMLGNDRVGDCFWAGAAHETMLFNGEAQRKVSFTDESVISDYSAQTGYDPNKSGTDNGTYCLDGLKYRAATGVLDASGQRHKIGAFVALASGNLHQLFEAMYLFGAVGVGLALPGSAMDQFTAGQPWAPVPGSSIEGGHYVPFVASRDLPLCVTWNQIQKVQPSFYMQYCDEAYAVLSEEILTKGVSPEHFDMAALRADLNQIRGIK